MTGAEVPPVRGGAGARTPVVVDASAVVVVDGSSTMVGPGRAVEVLVALPMTRPRCDFSPPLQAAEIRVTATARPTTPVLRKAELCMRWSTFPERVEMLERLTDRL